MENTIKYFSEVIKSQGLSGLLAIIIWVYGSQYAETLAKIQEQIVQIRVQLASINQKYAQKSAVRDIHLQPDNTSWTPQLTFYARG